jgi:hypothetical protein
VLQSFLSVHHEKHQTHEKNAFGVFSGQFQIQLIPLILSLKKPHPTAGLEMGFGFGQD